MNLKFFYFKISDIKFYKKSDINFDVESKIQEVKIEMTDNVERILENENQIFKLDVLVLIFSIILDLEYFCSMYCFAISTFFPSAVFKDIFDQIKILIFFMIIFINI